MQNLLLSLNIISPKFIPLYCLFIFSEEGKKKKQNQQSQQRKRQVLYPAVVKKGNVGKEGCG